MAREVVIVGAARTPIGAFQGSLSKLTAPQLGAIAIKAALERAGVAPDQVSETIMGCVLQAGVGQAPARQAAIFAGIPDSVPAVTLNKVCGSGLKAVIAGAQAIALGDAEVVVAGGMESMSNAPYLSPNMRGGARMGHVEFKDALIHDGLWDVYGNVHMGICAEECSTSQGIPRSAQDEYALESTRRAIAAQQAGLFTREIVPVTVTGGKGGDVVVSEDEGPKNAKVEKIPTLKSVFKKDGTVTAANSASINDGAAALVLMSAERAKKEGRTVLGRITGHAGAARKPVEFTIAPTDAINALLKRTGHKVGDVDLWEINEAFAAVTMAAMTEFELSHERVNVHGGACALGHPIGASGARIVVTLLGALRQYGFKKGVAALCIGGGEATAIAVERL